MSNIRQRTFDDKNDIDNLYKAVDLESDERQALSETVSDINLTVNSFNKNIITSEVGTIESVFSKIGHTCTITGAFKPINNCPIDTVIMANIPSVGNISNSVGFIMYDNTKNDGSLETCVLNNNGTIACKKELIANHSYRFTVSYVTQN